MVSLKINFYITLAFTYICICENASMQRSTSLRQDTEFRQTPDFIQNEQENANNSPEIKTKKSEVISGRTFRTNEDSHSQGRRIDKGHNKTRQKSGFYNSYRR